MAVRQEFKFTPPEGQEYISFDEWSDKLPPREKAGWVAACARQHAIRAQYVEHGQLEIDKSDPDNNSYVWDETLVEQKPKFEYKEYDDEWLCFWNRYLEETGIKFEIVETKI
jgi:hypothetical protein